MEKYLNVRERWTLYDTVLISGDVANLPTPVSGWFSTFAQLGSMDAITFFDSRNRSIPGGIAYNNLDSQDQLSFPFWAESISVAFFSPSSGSSMFEAQTTPAPYSTIRTDYVCPFFEFELPTHAAMKFRTNQDERLTLNAMMAEPGYGPIGHAMGQGDMGFFRGVGYSYSVGGQGRAHPKFRWMFSKHLGIEKRATISVEIRFSEWARNALQSIWGPGYQQFWPHTGVSNYDVPANYARMRYQTFGIQAAISGYREVQQRGQYHA